MFCVTLPHTLLYPTGIYQREKKGKRKPTMNEHPRRGKNRTKVRDTVKSRNAHPPPNRMLHICRTLFSNFYRDHVD